MANGGISQVKIDEHKCTGNFVSDFIFVLQYDWDAADLKSFVPINKTTNYPSKSLLLALTRGFE